MPLHQTTRRLGTLIVIRAVPLAAASSAKRFRLWMQLAENYSWLRSQETWARGMVPATPDQGSVVIEPSRVRAQSYDEAARLYHRAAWRFWEPIPSPLPAP
jgi:hypothetical protein